MHREASDRSVAIIGIGCRFPGGVTTPQEFWDFLFRGGDAITEVPAERWDAGALFAADPGAPGRTYARRGGFLDGIRRFDPEFFGISPREAEEIDPQQRLLLETAHEAMEDAGERWEDAAVRNTGVFVGVFIHDYQHMQFAERDRLGAHSGTGTAMSITANRVSYVFDLKGPSVAVDTACSSSLVAVDLACKALLSGECDFALAGGVNAILKPEMTIAMSKATMLSRDGRCKSFDSRADGYVRGEGAAMLLLRRANEARTRNRVYALIRASGVNSDGKTPGISVPSGDAQEALTRRILADAGVRASSVGYVEAHGTGTPVGDPIEATALGRVFREGRSGEDPTLRIGSVKTNVGHLESASGVAGLIKAALCVKHGQIPRNLHFETGNPAIDFDGLRLRVVTENEPWANPAGPRRAAVNSFGFGGTNAHVLIEEAPELPPPAPREGSLPRFILPLGAHHSDALRALAGAYAESLQNGTPVRDLLYTASQRRSHGAERAAFSARTEGELIAQLRALAAGNVPAGCARGVRAEGFSGRPVLVFSGMGTQWWAMARELMEMQPTFRAELERVDQAVERHAGWSVLEELSRTEATSRIQETEIAQPAIFAVQTALFALLRHWGVEPGAIVGHSVGEIAALHAAGVLSRDDAARVAYHRSRLQARTAGSGGMLAVALTVEEARPLLEEFSGLVSIAAVNSPTALTLSGDFAALQHIRTRLEAQETFARLLRVEVPYHSAKMEVLREDLLAALADVSPQPARFAYYSTTDRAGSSLELGDAQYWWRNVRQPVLFAAAIERALTDGHCCFLEVGPHPALQGSISECLASHGVRGKAVGTLRRGSSDFDALGVSIAELHVFGTELAWEQIVGSGALAQLPTYPWQRAEYWSESERAEAYRKGVGINSARVSTSGGHALLGAKLDLSSTAWLNTLRLADHAYVSDHRVQGSVVFPGAGFFEMALQTLVEGQPAELDEDQCLILKDVEIGRALHVRAGEDVELQTTREGERWSVSSCTSSDKNWVRHATGRCRREKVGRPATLRLESVRERCRKPLPSEYAYRLFADVGLEYGPAFRGIRKLWYGQGECLAQVEVPETLEQRGASAATHLFHPALLDACLHTLFGALNLNGEDADKRGNVFLPVSVEQLRLYRRAPRELWSHARLKTKTAQHFTADISVYDADDELVCEVIDLRCQAIESTVAIAQRREREWLLEYEWQPANRPEPKRDLSGRWLVLSPESEHPLLRELRGRGAECVVVTPPNSTDVAATLATALESGSFEGIVHAWCLHGEHEPEHGSTWQLQELGALSVLSLVQSLAQRVEYAEGARRSPPLWILTTLAQPVTPGTKVRVAHSTVWGLRRVIANEHPGLHARCVDLDGSPTSLRALAAELAENAPEDELAFRDGARFAHRLRRLDLAKREPVLEHAARRMELRVEKPGDLRSLEWVSLPDFDLDAHEVEIEVHATGLNFKDVMKATGLFPRRLLEGNLWSGETLGMECAGTVARVGSAVRGLERGQAVMALAPRTFASHAITHEALVVSNPELSSPAAATVPVAFLTACVALEHEARLEPGERVLIHAASGGVGLAALQVALARGAEVFATAGSDEKRELLRELGVRHVFDSRSLRFGDDIREVTNGEGVDVVLNSLSGDAITESLGLLRDYGRFIEIGKMDLERDFPLGLRPFSRCLSFHAVDLDRMLAQRVELCGRILASIRERLAQGVFRTLPARLYATSEATDAFQMMASARHTGKLVLDISPGTVAVRHAGGLTFRRDASYLVTGGLTGFGLQLAQWLAERGAGHLVLLGRRGKQTPGAELAIARLQEHGASVSVESCDIADLTQTREVLARLPHDRPLRGVFHAAAVLDDALLKNLDRERYRKTFEAKASGAWNLHVATLSAPLDYFMCFSSMASVLGNQGSGNYCAANAFVDALAHCRRALDLPALSVNWGVIADVGMAADEDFYRQNLERNGLKTIHSRHCLELLGLLLESRRTQTTVCPIDFDTWLKFNPAGREGRLSELATSSQLARSASRNQTAEELALREKLDGLDENARVALARDTVARVLAHVLRTPLDKVEPSRSLTALGADSLMAIEIKNRLESFGLAVSVTQLLNRNSASTLAEMLLQSLGYAPRSSTQSSVKSQASSWFACNAQRPQARLRLICFPYAGGGPSVYHRWSSALPTSIEVRTICLPGRGPRVGEANIASISEAADAIVPELLPLLDRPFALFGHCMGAILMYEVAQRLEARHDKRAARLFVSGCMAPHLYNSPVVHEQENAAFLDVLRLISFSGTRALIEDEELRSSTFPLLRGDFRAVAEYGSTFSIRPALNAPITGLAAENDLFAAPKAMHAWRRYTTHDYDLIKLPGDHYFIESDRDRVTQIVAARLEPEPLAASAGVTIPEPVRPDADKLGEIPSRSSRSVQRAIESVIQPATVFCFPGVGLLSDEFPIPKSAEREYRSVDWRLASEPDAPRAVAQAVDRALRALKGQLAVPFAFYGHCLGAIVAYELALRLRREGLPAPTHLVTAGAVGPHLYVAPDAHRLPTPKLLELLRVLKHPAAIRLECDPQFQLARLPVVRADFEAMANYQYVDAEPLDCPITAMSLRHDLWSYPLRTDSWRHHTAHQCKVVERAGDHYLTLREPDLIDDLLRPSASGSVAAE